MDNPIEQALALYKNAAMNLVEVKKRRFSVDGVVTINNGKGKAVVRITACPECWHCDPGRLVGVNVNTGKRRNFDIKDIVFDDEGFTGCDNG